MTRPTVTIAVVHGDITSQEVDAVVNAANTSMRGGGGVDGAIHRAGGPAILADCIARFPSGLATGQAGWTTAGDLPATWVIHVVGPVYTREDAAKRHQLSSCYTNALRVADELGARSVAFPLVSAGAYGWPVSDAARVAVQALGSVATNVQEARLVAFNAAAYEALTQELEAAG
jgi:O-acetyl-ADP-ribose deacetylase (regulator of RNase III)